MARAKMEEEASLYKYRATTHEIQLTNEGEVDSEVVRQTFPMYDTEFEELGGEGEGKSEEREELGGVGDKQEPLCQFTCSEMREVSELHQKLFGAQQPSNSSQSSEVFSSRYSFAASLAQLLDHIPGTITFYLQYQCLSSPSLSPGLSTDYSLFGAHARMCSDTLGELSQGTPGKLRLEHVSCYTNL